MNHVRIHTCEDAGKEKFYMQENMLFDSLYALVEHYRAYPLKSSAFSIKLGDPCSSVSDCESALSMILVSLSPCNYLCVVSSTTVYCSMPNLVEYYFV